MLKEWNLNLFENSQWILHPEEQDPMDVQSYAAKNNITEELKGTTDAEIDDNYDNEDDDDDNGHHHGNDILLAKL
jgi:hypothetical protein